MGLSRGPFLNDLNDFISPAQECVKPVESPPIDAHHDSQIKYDHDSGNYYQVDKDSKTLLKPATITLADCLACSGCITSAETVLVTEQSLEKVERMIQQRTKTIVFSISPQTRASLASRHSKTLQEIQNDMVGALNSLGIIHVFDTNLGRDIHLLVSAQEFVSRYKTGKLPLISSSCPGWICYAEKTRAFVLEHLSRVKSPQQIMGSMVKQHFGKRMQKQPDEIYHVTVMPCYDKKLEASRDDFSNNGVCDVDCVLTTGEFGELMNKHLEQVSTSSEDNLQIYGSGDNGSGGTLEFILKHASRELFGRDLDTIPANVSMIRNKDFWEYVVKDSNGNQLLKMAMAYGFRNIQNILRRLESQRNVYDYIEIMACPLGCLNGGGQFPTGKSGSLDKVRTAYDSAIYRSPKDNFLVQDVIRDWLGGLENASMLYTQYHAVEPKTFRIRSSW